MTVKFYFLVSDRRRLPDGTSGRTTALNVRPQRSQNLSKVNDELRTFITEQLGGLVKSAAEVLPPLEFAQTIVNEDMSDEYLAAIVKKVSEILKMRNSD